MEAIDTIQSNMNIKFVDSYWEDLFNRMENLRRNLSQPEQTQNTNSNTNKQ